MSWENPEGWDKYRNQVGFFVIVILLFCGLVAMCVGLAGAQSNPPPGGYGEIWWVNSGSGITINRFENDEVTCYTVYGAGIDCLWKRERHNDAASTGYSRRQDVSHQHDAGRILRSVRVSQNEQSEIDFASCMAHCSYGCFRDYRSNLDWYEDLLPRPGSLDCREGRSYRSYRQVGQDF